LDLGENSIKYKRQIVRMDYSMEMIILLIGAREMKIQY